MLVCCECCVLLGRGLCDESITRPEKSHRMWCVVVCYLETSWKRRPWPALGRSATEKKKTRRRQLPSTETVHISKTLFFKNVGFLHWTVLPIHYSVPTIRSSQRSHEKQPMVAGLSNLSAATKQLVLTSALPTTPAWQTAPDFPHINT